MLDTLKTIRLLVGDFDRLQYGDTIKLNDDVSLRIDGKMWNTDNLQRLIFTRDTKTETFEAFIVEDM